MPQHIDVPKFPQQATLVESSGRLPQPKQRLLVCQVQHQFPAFPGVTALDWPTSKNFFFSPPEQSFKHPAAVFKIQDQLILAATRSDTVAVSFQINLRFWQIVIMIANG